MTANTNRQKAVNAVIGLIIAEVFKHCDDKDDIKRFVIVLAKTIKKDEFIKEFNKAFNAAIKKVKAYKNMHKASDSYILELAITAALLEEIFKISDENKGLALINRLTSTIDSSLFTKVFDIDIKPQTDKLIRGMYLVDAIKAICEC